MSQAAASSPDVVVTPATVINANDSETASHVDSASEADAIDGISGETTPHVEAASGADSSSTENSSGPLGGFTQSLLTRGSSIGMIPTLAASILLSNPTPFSSASQSSPTSSSSPALVSNCPSTVSSNSTSSSSPTVTTSLTTTSTTSSTTATSSSNNTFSMFPQIPDDDEADDDDDERANLASAAAGFECHICLDIAKDAVVSLCGHLFCWPCLHQWLETRPTVQLCPVCKAGISKDKVVPLYGRGGNGEQKDPRTKPPPPRPQGQRSEPEAQGGLGAGAFGGWPGMIFGDGGSHLSFGIGAFPFAFFASAFNLNDGRPPPPELGTPQYAEERFLNRVFVCVSVLFAIWLLLL